ncbi:hypothetical protein CMI37_10310 [Candidatus Pacearchaeota archaeon]|nr:hypothetical protein [Candidatus Pacearchaeota archaeon]|tara:strand:+ start:80 stop:1522 length:1443 start_codon:yes stop_codon:yes gene_type:complete
MPFDVIVGRDESDKKLFGKKGLAYVGKSYVTMGNLTSLSNPIFLDVARSHVILVAGKRGSGKSYTLGAIAEAISDLKKEAAGNIAPLIFDTMGIFWTMKYKNEKDRELLEEWGLGAKNVPVKVFAPFGYFQEYKEKGIDVDAEFAIKISELEASDWISLFELEFTEPIAVVIESVIGELKGGGDGGGSKRPNSRSGFVSDSEVVKTKSLTHPPKNSDVVKATSNSKSFASGYSLDDIRKMIGMVAGVSQDVKNSAVALFDAAETWKVFSEEKGTAIRDLVNAGTTTVVDLSMYASTGNFNVRGLIIGLVSKRLFDERMAARKNEEIQAVQHGLDYAQFNIKREMPIVWIFIDEAHEFLPKEGETPASAALVQLLREGRQPGISLVLATQQPGKIHTDAMTQSDIVISHRVTAEQDVKALNEIMQSYFYESINQKLNELPRLKGSALILDDNSERIYPMRVRPRFTWHGGEAPTAVKGGEL